MQAVIDPLDLFSNVYQQFLVRAWPDQTSRLHKAIQYCLSGDGKRVRAQLAMLVCKAYGKDPRLAVTGAIAVEMVHAYSLSHDDLPCMDNDDFRRGRPSLHRAFDEATALLAGDAILTDAFRVLSDKEFFQESDLLTTDQRLRSVAELALAAGGHGMVYGQDADMYWTGKGHYDLQTLEKIHRGKTGALLGASAAIGAIAGGASSGEVSHWREFGVMIGLAFQAVDDLLDESKSTGKSTGKDKAQGKLTYLSLFTNDEVLNLAKRYTEAALAHVPQQASANAVTEFVQKLVFRKK
jgi:geranylgeranyl diphosphate synthase type II